LNRIERLRSVCLKLPREYISMHCNIIVEDEDEIAARRRQPAIKRAGFTFAHLDQRPKTNVGELAGLSGKHISR
jgi:hypothetical protein